MSGADPVSRVRLSIVLADANVLYSRVLRDYVLYAMAHQLIGVRWSKEILDEMVEHLVENIEGFDESSGERLTAAMDHTFPYSRVTLTDDAWTAVENFALVDEDDRHVLAAAVAAEADFVCTDDRAGFPAPVMADLHIEVITPDALLSALIEEVPGVMLAVHRSVVAGLRGATDDSTIVALRAAQAPRAADLMLELLRRFS